MAGATAGERESNGRGGESVSQRNNPGRGGDFGGGARADFCLEALIFFFTVDNPFVL